MPALPSAIAWSGLRRRAIPRPEHAPLHLVSTSAIRRIADLGRTLPEVADVPIAVIEDTPASS
jgi:hypothetical protein